MPSTAITSRAVTPPPVQEKAYGRHRVDLASKRGGILTPLPSRIAAQDERLLRIRDLLTIVGLSRAHVYNLVKQGLFPPPIALGSNCARWVHSEVQGWVGDSIVTAPLTRAERQSRTTHSR